MATIAENLQTIKNSTAAIKKAILDKGGTISGDITTWAGAIDGIQTGGGGSSPSRPTYTGHADVEGLKAIGWTDEDIAYYQANGVNWNEEDDQFHKVPEDNIALYGVLTASNISTYKERIVYLPKIDTSSVMSMKNMFNDCYPLVSIPQLDTSRVTSMGYMFRVCYSIQTVYLNGIKMALQVNNTSLLTKDSLLYIINNEAATSAITITLSTYCYNKYSADADVVAALSNHPNISLAK